MLKSYVHYKSFPKPLLEECVNFLSAHSTGDIRLMLDCFFKINLDMHQLEGGEDIQTYLKGLVDGTLSKRISGEEWQAKLLAERAQFSTLKLTVLDSRDELYAIDTDPKQDPKSKRWNLKTKDGSILNVWKNPDIKYGCAKQYQTPSNLYILNIYHGTKLIVPNKWTISYRVNHLIYFVLSYTQENCRRLHVWDTSKSATFSYDHPIYQLDLDQPYFICLDEHHQTVCNVNQTRFRSGKWEYQCVKDDGNKIEKSITVHAPGSPTVEVARFRCRFGSMFTFNRGILTDHWSYDFYLKQYDFTKLDRIRTKELEPVLSTEALRIHILSFLVLEEAWAWRERQTK